jgi:hypothetical protein
MNVCPGVSTPYFPPWCFTKWVRRVFWLHERYPIRDAERALAEKTDWFNSDLEWPQWPDSLNQDQYEICELLVIQ